MPNVPPGIQTIPGCGGLPGVSGVLPGSSCDVIVSPSSCGTTGGRSNISITADLLANQKIRGEKFKPRTAFPRNPSFEKPILHLRKLASPNQPASRLQGPPRWAAH